MKPQNIREEVKDRVKRIIERRKAFCTRKHWWQSVDPLSFSSLDSQFYDETRDRAVELGFAWLGDFELMRDPPAETIGRTFERVMVGDEGRIQLYFAHVRSEGRQRLLELEADAITNARNVVLATEFEDGSFLFTDNMRGRLPMPLLDKVPQFRTIHLGWQSAIDALVKLHRATIELDGQKPNTPRPRAFVTAEETFGSRLREHAISAAFTKAVGYIEEDTEFAPLRERFSGDIVKKFISEAKRLKAEENAEGDKRWEYE